MSRSLKKGPYIDEKLAKKVAELKNKKISQINTYARASVIFPEMVGISVNVHNGKTFIPVKIAEEMVGHRLGEFSPTRKFIKHGGRIAREEAASEAAGAVKPAETEAKTETKKEK